MRLKNVAIIICTKNRATDLNITLQSVMKQTVKPTAILVVDDSDEIETTLVANQFPSVTYYHPFPSTGGLTAARNFGVHLIPDDTHIVLFLDDDVTLDTTYLKHIIDQFHVLSDTVGVGGLVTGGYNERKWYVKPILAILGFLLPTLIPASPFDYKVTRTGQATTPLYLKPVHRVEWLSGCNMAYRKEVFYNHEFYEPFKGYGFGEDVLFSHQLYREGKELLITTDAKIEHRVSKTNRDAISDRIVNTMYIIRRFYGYGIMGTIYCRVLAIQLFISGLVLSLVKGEQ
jgi:glycosyltransferase involved in cell wall biosynthesis